MFQTQVSKSYESFEYSKPYNKFKFESKPYNSFNESSKTLQQQKLIYEFNKFQHKRIKFDIQTKS